MRTTKVLQAKKHTTIECDYSGKIGNKNKLILIGTSTTATSLLNNILCRKASWVGHILRKNSILHDETVGQMAEV